MLGCSACKTGFPKVRLMSCGGDGVDTEQGVLGPPSSMRVPACSAAEPIAFRLTDVPWFANCRVAGTVSTSLMNPAAGVKSIVALNAPYAGAGTV